MMIKSLSPLHVDHLISPFREKKEASSKIERITLIDFVAVKAPVRSVADLIKWQGSPALSENFESLAKSERVQSVT